MVRASLLWSGGARDMHKVLVFTDIHILPEGETVIGLDPLARFAQGLAHALEHHPDAARIVLCGDLAHNAAPAEYARLKQALAGCPLPMDLMLGNHDRRAPFLAEFTQTPVTDAGFIQHYQDISDYRLIFLDTLNEEADDTHSGHLCAQRLDWLDQALATAGARRVVVFTHHPPIITGFSGMDWIGLHNRAELIGRLVAHGGVVQIVSGHIHRTIQGAAGGIPVSIFKSPCHQMPMALGFQDPSLSIDEPGAYGIVLLHDDGVIVHTEDFTLPPVKAAIYG